MVSNTKKLLYLNYNAARLFISTSFLLLTLILIDDGTTDYLWLVFGYLLIAGLHHSWQTTFGKKTYLEYVRRRYNPWRWLEYSITCTLMTILVGVVVGIRSTLELVIIGVSIVFMNYTGYLIETHYQHFGRAHYKYFYIGSILATIPFLLMFKSYGEEGGVNGLVTILILLALYITFPLNVYKYLNNPNEKFLTYEATFTVLSLISKLIIALVVISVLL